MKRQDYLTACAVVELLAERFPKTFFVHEQRRRPLKVGIDLDLKATLDGALGAREMKLALMIYCRNKCYRAKLRKGAWRVDLAGNVVDTIMQDLVPPTDSTRSQMEGRHLCETGTGQRGQPPRGPL